MMFTVSWGAYCVLSPGFISLFATAGAEQMIFDTEPEGGKKTTNCAKIMTSGDQLQESYTRGQHLAAEPVCFLQILEKYL